MCVHGPLKPRHLITWPTYLINKMHLQFLFVLEASGYIKLQRNGFRWMLHYMGKPYPVVLHPYVHSLLMIQKGMTGCVVITLHRLQR